MIELVLVYCLSTAPDRRMERREVRAGGSPIECTMKAQAIAQEYVVDLRASAYLAGAGG